MIQNQDELNECDENLRQIETDIAALKEEIAFMKRYYLRAQDEGE